MSSPISGISGVNFAPAFERSCTNTAFPCLPVPRSDTVSTAKRSSSVVLTVWNRCGFFGSSNTSVSSACGVPTR